MKTFYLLIFTILFISKMTSQISYEFGPQLFHFNLMADIDDIPERSRLQVFNGVMFKYIKSRIAIRVGLNYGIENVITNSDRVCSDCYEGYAKNKIFQMIWQTEYIRHYISCGH